MEASSVFKRKGTWFSTSVLKDSFAEITLGQTQEGGQKSDHHRPHFFLRAHLAHIT